MKELLENGRLVWRLINDPRVPGWIKFGVPLLVAVYVLSPIDVIPDFLVGPGQLDDLGVVLLGMTLMVRLSPQHVVEEHKRALGYDVDGSASAGGPGGRSYWAPPPNASRGSAQEPKQAEQSTIEGEYRVIPPDSDRPYAD
jgi:uncharacterized membrane protein YkvA (DUF1232 family)